MSSKVVQNPFQALYYKLRPPITLQTTLLETQQLIRLSALAQNLNATISRDISALMMMKHGKHRPQQPQKTNSAFESPKLTKADSGENNTLNAQSGKIQNAIQCEDKSEEDHDFEDVSFSPLNRLLSKTQKNYNGADQRSRNAAVLRINKYSVNNAIKELPHESDQKNYSPFRTVLTPIQELRKQFPGSIQDDWFSRVNDEQETTAFGTYLQNSHAQSIPISKTANLEKNLNCESSNPFLIPDNGQHSKVSRVQNTNSNQCKTSSNFEYSKGYNKNKQGTKNARSRPKGRASDQKCSQYQTKLTNYCSQCQKFFTLLGKSYQQDTNSKCMDCRHSKPINSYSRNIFGGVMPIGQNINSLRERQRLQNSGDLYIEQ